MVADRKSQLIGSSSCLILKILVKNAAGRVLYIYELTNAWDLKYFPLLNKNRLEYHHDYMKVCFQTF